MLMKKCVNTPDNDLQNKMFISAHQDDVLRNDARTDDPEMKCVSTRWLQLPDVW